MIRAFVMIGLLITTGAVAQTSVKTTAGSGAVLRSLDRITGEVKDYELKNGEAFQRGKMTVELSECRYPVKAINRDAFTFLKISDTASETPQFEGWMIASSPALSALEHPRYDVWVLRCIAP